MGSWPGSVKHDAFTKQTNLDSVKHDAVTKQTNVDSVKHNTFYKTNKYCSFWDQSELIVLAFNKYIIQEKTELSGISKFFMPK